MKVKVIEGKIFVYKDWHNSMELTPKELMELMPQLQKALNEVTNGKV